MGCHGNTQPNLTYCGQNVDAGEPFLRQVVNSWGYVIFNWREFQG